jgi:hypothetical protein
MNRVHAVDVHARGFYSIQVVFERFCQLTRRTISPGGEVPLYDAVDIYRCFALFIPHQSMAIIAHAYSPFSVIWEVSFFALDFFPR